MSADSSKRQSKQAITGHVILPQPVNDPSIIDSVAGFIHEVVPQACQSVLSAAGGGEVNKESIVWAKFHSTDYNDPENFLADTECQSDSVPPLLVVLGYGSGVQVWGISGGGEGRELLSYPQGNVRCLQILHSPQLHPSKDPLASKRPLISLVDNTGPGPQYQTLNFISLRTAEVVKSIKFKTAICDVVCNKKSIVVTFAERIAIFDVLTLEDRLTVTTCYPSPGINPNPVALGPRWLAYCDKKLTTWQRSSGGCEDEGAQSYTATVIHAAKSLGKGLRDLSGSFTGTAAQPQSSTSQPGIVTVIDIETPRSAKHQGGEEDQTNASNMVAHFVGHTGPIVAMTFDPSGMLLVIADKHGHRFNVFRLHPHPSSPALAAVHHLYILHRGDTTARVQDVSVSWDSRWVAVSSLRGTTHVFPITPYGGPVAVRTHTTPHVVNRLSRFERSAGLSDGRGSPEGAASVLCGSPRLPPYPHPVVLTPLAQIRRTPTGIDAGDSTPAPTVLRLAAKFAPPRALLPPRATPPRTPRHQPKPRVADSLFIISSYGSLVQYDIEPRSPANIPKDKISYDTGIEVSVEAKGEWVLVRPPCFGSVQPPLPQGSPLLPPAPLTLTHTSRLVETHSPQLHHPAKGQDDRWLSQVEIITHTGPHRRLWMGPQFSFKSLDQSNASEGEVPEPENVPPRSNPVNMPRRPYLWIESSSGGSVDAPYMTDNSEDDSIHGETRLREDLADAMMDTALHASGGLVEGGEERHSGAVEGVDKTLERRITQFGLVVPISPVVLPDVRVPLPPLDMASRISTTAVQRFEEAVILPAAYSPSHRDSGTTGFSDNPLEPLTNSIEPVESLEINIKTQSEVATCTSTYSSPPTSVPLLTRVDAQTETSPFELIQPSVSDKSLNTSIIFEQVHLPLSSRSENSAEVSEQSESSSTDKFNSNSSSENVSSQESSIKKTENPSKKSKNKKSDNRDKSSKIKGSNKKSDVSITDRLSKGKQPENRGKGAHSNSDIAFKSLVKVSDVTNDGDVIKIVESSTVDNVTSIILTGKDQIILSGIMSKDSDAILEKSDKTAGLESDSEVKIIAEKSEDDANSKTSTKNVNDCDEYAPVGKSGINNFEPSELFQVVDTPSEYPCVLLQYKDNLRDVSLEELDYADQNLQACVSAEDESSDLMAFTPNDEMISILEDVINVKENEEIVVSESISKFESIPQEIDNSIAADSESLTEPTGLTGCETSVLSDLPTSKSMPDEKEFNSSDVPVGQNDTSFDNIMTTSSALKKSGKSKRKKKGTDKIGKETVKESEIVFSIDLGESFSDLPVERSGGSQLSKSIQNKAKGNNSSFTEGKSSHESSSDRETGDTLLNVKSTSGEDKITCKDSDELKLVESLEFTDRFTKDIEYMDLIESSEKALESAESIESSGRNIEATEISGKDLLSVPKKKGKSGKKNKTLQATSLKDVEAVHVEHNVHGESVSEFTDMIRPDFDKSIVNTLKTVEGNKGTLEISVLENIEEVLLPIPVVCDSVTEIGSYSISEDNRDQISTREETSDTINKSDSEFFVPFIEKRKKKRKNVKEKEQLSKTDGKESSTSVTDVETTKKEESCLEIRRSRRESRSKAKSPSPSPKSDVAVDSESSDEAILAEVKIQTPKLPRRRKASKRSDTSETCDTEVSTKTKSEGTSDIDYETCSEKKSDSSVDSFFDRIRTIDPFSKSWSGPVGDDKANIEDRDSVYESCNDDEFLNGASANTPIESLPEAVPLESSSSLTEDKTDSGDKDVPSQSQASSKKHKKQKKKKR